MFAEAENWRKTAQDLDIDLKQVHKANEKLLKEKLITEEDYQKVATAAGELQTRVHNLEEEIKEIKLKADLDNEEKEKVKFTLEKLQAELNQEGIPMCPLCNKRFPTIDVLEGHIDINHGDTTEQQGNDGLVMENSEQTGYGTTKGYQLVSVQCKKCDETLQNNHLLKIHMRKHMRKDQQTLKCTNCEYETEDENAYLQHIVDKHSTIHNCQTCGNRFPTKEELIGHTVREHFFHTNNPVNQAANNQIECYDCGAMFTSRDEMMTHKKKQHWKQKRCNYYWSLGSGCRFPDRVCYNIHGQEEFQGQVRSRQEVRRQETGGQVSWAGVARGQVTRQGWSHNARDNIDCRDGSQCRYNWKGSCRYRHNNQQNNQTNSQTNNQTNNQNNNQINSQNKNQTNINQNNRSETDDSSFNMQEMKITLDNLVKVVYNLKSLADFLKVNPENKSN